MQANRKEVYEEFQRKKTNPKELIRQERKREAEKLLARQVIKFIDILVINHKFHHYT